LHSFVGFIPLGHFNFHKSIKVNTINLIKQQQQGQGQSGQAKILPAAGIAKVRA